MDVDLNYSVGLKMTLALGYKSDNSDAGDI